MNQVKELRLKLGLSQQSFAELLGCGISSVARWEGGTNKPSQLALIRIQQLADNQIKGSSLAKEENI